MCKTLAETLEYFFKILGGMLLLGAAFLWLMLLISFSVSPISTVLNEKKSWFFRRILGWNFYLPIVWSIESVIPSDFLVVMKLLSVIFNVDTAFLKNSFRSLICDLQFPLFKKNSLIVFQNNLLSVTKDRLSYWKTVSFLLYTVCCKSFPVSYML